MAQKPVAIKVVFDTNTVISATLFGNGLLKSLRAAWQTDQLKPAVSKETVAELLRVLAYEKFRLAEADIARVLALYLPYSQLHAVHLNLVDTKQIPICGDVSDQIFLELAYFAKADFLVTGDQDLLVLAQTPNLPFRILKPAEFLTQQRLLS